MLKGKITRLIPLAFLLIFIVSCTKEPDEIGLDLQPDSEELQTDYADTTSIVAYSQMQDSVRTSFTSHSLIGAFIDPVFGKTNADMYSQLSLSSSGVDFGENPELDSITLQMIYAGNYGDESTQQTLKIYELKEAISSNIDSVYYSNQTIEIKEDKQYLDHTFEPSPNDSIWVDSTTSLSPRLIVNLSDELGNKFLNATEDQLADDNSFTEWFKGIYMTSDIAGEGDGSLLYLDVTNAESYIRLYYHNDEEDSLSYDFEISMTTPRFAHYNHFGYNDASQEFKQQVLNGDTALGQEKFYLQGTGGVASRIHFPFIRDWSSLGNIAIHEAKLIFSPIYSEGDPEPPEEMALVALDEDDGQYVLDDQLEGDTYFGGTYNESKNQYYFRITRYIQSLIGEQDTIKPNGLRMVVSGGAIYGNRAIINGPESEENPIKLEITYSKLD
ncbi:MAG: DUF4270 domain-containing protein [Bacteroidales bacterium]|nr:DUF4270 domain-containing protein [Bacteroidales bacterium]